MSSFLAQQLREVLEEIDLARRQAAITYPVKLIAVSKTFPSQAVLEAYTAGQLFFGENKVQEGSDKIQTINNPDLEWHLIGHLQSNKAAKAVELFDVIHSVDSLKLAQKISAKALSLGKTQKILFQINTSLEDSKSGLTPDLGPIADILGASLELPALDIQGLMTIGPLNGDQKAVSAAFQTLRNLRDQLQSQFSGLQLNELSMGMSGDFALAIREGATMVRVGSRIFGGRA
jgi:hypothetical protein